MTYDDPEQVAGQRELEAHQNACPNTDAHDLGFGYHESGTFFCNDCDQPVSGRGVSNEQQAKVDRNVRVRAALHVRDNDGESQSARYLATLVLIADAPGLLGV